MSMKEEISVKCPKCGCTLEAEMWRSANVTLNPEFKGQILDGTFGEVICRNCGEPAHIMYPFWYHDMKLERMVYVLASQGEDSREQIEKIESLPQQLGVNTFSDMLKDASYEFRIVSNLDALKEKILIWDAGLDDCIVEVAKAFTLLMAREQVDLEKVQDIFFYDGNEGGPEFQLYFKNGEYGYTAFPQETYDMVRKDFAEIIERHKTNRPQKIDLEWGFQVVEDILDSRGER